MEKKYISAEKLIAEIKALKRRKGFLPFENTEITEAYMARGVQFTCDDIVNLIISLQQEQPELPSNLDEAAEEEIERFCSDMLNVDIIWARMPLTKRFGLQMAKFGAEWMAGQGYAREVEVKEDAGGYPYIPSIELYDYDKDEPLFKPGDKVIVQIRKK